MNIETKNHSEYIQKLAIDKLYNEHIDYVEEIINKVIGYNHSYYDALIENFRGIGIGINEMDNIIWGTYTTVAELGNRPFSKLTNDILAFFEIK